MYCPTVSIPVFPEIISGAVDACRKHGYSLFISHLDKHAVSERRYLKILSRSKKFTAVFVSDLTSSIGAISAIQHAGLRIPEDISIIGFHDAPISEVLVPPLTVVKMPLYEMGHRGADTLINMLEGNEIIESQLLAPIGIERRISTAPVS